MKKRSIVIATLLFVLGYYLTPIYLFVSQQFEVARSPLGWQNIPAELPINSMTLNSAFKQSDELNNAMLAKAREISAPSISAAIAIDGKLVWASAVGWADVENQIQATPDTAYRIGSTSKAITATLAARLVTLGKLDVKQPLENYKSDLPNAQWNALTFEQLMSHTSGLVGYENNTDYLGLYHSMALDEQFDTSTNSLRYFDDTRLMYLPGSGFYYSGYNTILASAVIEKILNKPFSAAMYDLVAEPRAISSLIPSTSASTQIHSIAYQTRNGQIKPWRNVNLSHKLAAGGFSSTPSSLVAIGSAWFDENFIDEKTRKVFWQPVPLDNGQSNPQNYAMGWRKTTILGEHQRKVVHWNHGGVSKGSQAWLMVIPEYQAVIAFTTNIRTKEFFDFADLYYEFLLAVSRHSQQDKTNI